MSATAPTNTQTLFHPGSVVHLNLLDEDAPRLVTVVFSDTIGLAVVFSPYESWGEYLGAESPAQPLPTNPLQTRFFPWHNIGEVSVVLGVNGYSAWLAERNGEAVSS